MKVDRVALLNTTVFLLPSHASRVARTRLHAFDSQPAFDHDNPSSLFFTPIASHGRSARRFIHGVGAANAIACDVYSLVNDRG
jgi:hypothetical protein